MMVTIAGAIIAAVMDPILIFGLHLGLEGAAISTVLARLGLAVVGLWYVQGHHRLLRPFVPAKFLGDVRQVGGVAGPAVLTNLATPVGSAFVTHSMASFGAAAIAGQATIDRITPVAFGLIFALSGAVGPIIGQNVGAKRPDRVRATLQASLGFVVAVVVVAWAVLALSQNWIVRAFSATGDAELLIRLFCNLTAGSFIFLGALFVGNAAFNNLGRSTLATIFNWGRATLGTIPLVAIGSQYGPAGILIGQSCGGIIFGSVAVIVALSIVKRGAGIDTIPGLAVPATPGSAAANSVGLARSASLGPENSD
jgi:Na+-driven multidrug efflux pump